MTLFGINYQHRQLYFLVGDVLIALLAIRLGHALRFGVGAQEKDLWGIVTQYTGASLFFISSLLVVLYLCDAYNSALDFRRRNEVIRLWSAVVVAFMLQLLVYAAFPHGWWGRSIAALTSLGLGFLLVGWRALLCRISPRPLFRRKALVVGAGPPAQLIANVIRSHHEYDGVYVVGSLDHPLFGHRRQGDFPANQAPLSPSDLPVLGTAAELKAVVAQHGIELIIVAIRGSMSSELTKQLLECKAQGLGIEEMPTIYKRLTGKVPILHLSDAWLIFGPVFSGTSRLGAAVQRLADVLIALVGALLTLPVVALAALAVRLESKGPAFYRQERLGRNEHPFQIIKLRTMRQDAEASSGAVWSQGASDPRVTRVGRFLRRSRIDELPQFYNVLLGDMAMVGPRPEREHFVTQLKERIPFYALRFSVKPGVTGWAQVRHGYGASEEDAAEKLCYELYAVQEMSATLYALILLKTVQTVLLRPGS
ncbi:MAG: exopolysaccharide biosynthesis polyprenyl glycosylphosphotransferase [Pseudomonadota bacterium]|nr:exopolysaccharide biosynthesis polyprenyl glycosylphosphotransferase [Pseudomonadota bacterium]